MSRPGTTFLAWILPGVLLACDRPSPPHGVGASEPTIASVLRLASQDQAASLRFQSGTAENVPEDEPLFADHFGGKVIRWVRVPDFDAPVADPARTAAPTGGVLTLGPDDGFLVAPVDVRALQELELTVRVRVDDARARPQVVLCGLNRSLPLRQELAERSLRDLWREYRSLGSEWQSVDGLDRCEPGAWTRARTTLRTSFDARTLWIVLSAGAEGGPVTFDDLVLRPRPVREVWADGGSPLPAVPGVDAPFVRRIEVLEDRRDGFVMPAPSTLTTTVTMPEGELVLEFATAVLPEHRSQHRAWPLRLTLTVREEGGEPREWWRRELDQAHPQGWQDAHLDVSALAGRAVELTWSVQTGRSADVVLVGAPLIRQKVITSSPPLVILVSLDTLRADRLTAAGYGKPTTPNLDRLARESVWFRQAQSTSAFTLPTHATVMTGQMPSVHGLQTPAAFEPLSATQADVLASRMQEAGYVTAAFTGGGYVSPDFGFAEGFDRYDTADLLLSGEDTRWFRAPVGDDPEFNRAFHDGRGLALVQDWLEQHGDGPAFLFLHTYLVHNYRPSPEFRARFHATCDSDLGLSQAWLKRRVEDPSAIPAADLRHYEELYDATLREADEAIGQLVQWLKDSGRWEDTVFVLFSDHGEEFLDHQSLGHGHSLYQELVHVPLLVHAPGAQARMIDEPVSLADLLPTLLDYLGEGPRHPVQGQSLRPVLEGGGVSPRRLLSELQHEGREWSALRAGRFKYLVRTSDPVFEAIFDLQEDPGETRNLLQEAGVEAVQDMASRLREELERHRNLLDGLGRASREGGGLSAEMLEELRALGYLDDGS